MSTHIPNSEVIAATNFSLSRLTSQASLKRGHVTHQPSMLDLIDNTTLTSLPLPPPPKLRGRMSTNSISTWSLLDLKPMETVEAKDESQSDESDDDGDADPIVLIEDYMIPCGAIDRKKSLATFKKRLFLQEMEVASMSEISTLDEWKEELREERGIVREEDLKEVSERSTNEQSDGKKTSEATNGSNAMTPCAESIPTPSVDFTSMGSVLSADSSVISPLLEPARYPQHIRTKRSISNEDWDVRGAEPRGARSQERTSRPTFDSISSHSVKRENLEEIFGQIPGTDMLKYCDLCEKPLYEISSIINNNKKIKKSMAICVYSEFVCWECVDAYEVFFNEMYESELKEAQNEAERPVNRQKLIEIFQGIDRKYEKPRTMRSFYRPKRVLKKTLFSENLIGKLSTLNAPEEKTWGRVDLEWIRNLQWRWGKG